MPATSHVYTIRRTAQILGRDEELLWDLSDQLEPEDGMLWILDVDNRETLAFTSRGIEALREIIADQVDRLVTAALSQVAPPGATFYTYGEPGRLARAVFYAHSRGTIGEDRWRAMLNEVVDPSPLANWNEAYSNEAGLAQRQTRKSRYANSAPSAHSRSIRQTSARSAGSRAASHAPGWNTPTWRVARSGIPAHA